MGDAAQAGYRVLARKYRPRRFEDLIGQDAVVQTLRNAFETGRIAQAYMLTGVRGVGKTTTARLIARALNYHVPGGQDGPTVHMDQLGEHCAAIMESRHVDVMEMDAASHTGIDDIREIIEAVRYQPASARYKVYIVDEVHMLSKAAFNGLLKTLEEPPPHVKFIFATTEIRKVPVTVLSRCQRFDLRRVDAGLLVDYFADIAGRENANVDREALVHIARASEGSVRDGLSLLDQALARGGEIVTGDDVRSMLGLVDRSRTIELFEAVMRGDMPGALAELKDQYDSGADPAVVLSDLAELVHWVTRLKVVPDAAGDDTVSQAERERGAELAGKLGMRVLARAWQMLLKGIDEVRGAANALAAADMVIVRLAHAADLPTPDEIIRSLEDGGGQAPARAPSNVSSAAPPPPAAPVQAGVPVERSITAAQAVPQPAERDGPPAAPDAPVLSSFEDVVELVGKKRDILLKRALEHDVRLVRFRPGQIDLALASTAHAGLANELGRKLGQWTGERWVVAVSREEGEKPLAEKAREQADQRRREAAGYPLVQAILEKFPDAKITSVTDMKDLVADHVEDAPPPEDDDADDFDF